LNAERAFREDLQGTNEKLTKNTAEAKAKNEELMKYVTEKKLLEDIQKEVDNDEDRVYRDQLVHKEQIIVEMNATKIEKQKELDQDERLKDLKLKNEDLNKKLKEKQSEFSDIDYKVMEMDHCQALAIKVKEKEALDRKNLYEEYENLKNILEETIRANNLKIEKKIRDNNCEELGKLEGVLRKLQGELNENRVRYDKIHKEYKNFKLDQLRKNTYKTKLVNENQK
jgi:hypothetical protein